MLTHPSLAQGSPGLNGIEFIQICRRVRSSLDQRRYRHVVGVARTAERLARRHGVSTYKARVAGMLHDIARGWSADALLAYAHEHGLAVNEDERAAPVLLHARIGADIARRQYAVDDSDTLAAITHHTVAVPGMSDLQKIVYLADSVEPSRQFQGRADVAALAERSLDGGMLACIASSLEYLVARRVPIASETITLYNELARKYEAKH